MQMCVCIWTFYLWNVYLRSLLQPILEHAMRITVTCVMPCHAKPNNRIRFVHLLITVHRNQTVMLSFVVQRKTELRNIIISKRANERMNEHFFFSIDENLPHSHLALSACHSELMCRCRCGCRRLRRRHFAVLIIHAQHNEPHSTFGFRIHAYGFYMVTHAN